MRNTSFMIYVRRISLFATLMVAGGYGVSAQTPSPTPSPAPVTPPTRSLEKHFVKNILRDQKAIWTSPLRLRSEDAKWLVPLGMGTAALMATDRRTGDAMAKSQRQVQASRIVSYAGSTYGAGGVAAGFYLLGRMTNNERARETGLLASEALINGIVVGSVVKGITQRVRPLGGPERSEFFEGGSSFPSGHSIQAWSVATVIAHEYHDRVAVQIAAYGIASAVSVARFTGHKHYLSDVLVGSALGYGIGNYVYHAHHRPNAAAGGGGEEEEEARTKSRWPLIAPQYDRHAHEYGVALTWSF